ncbi:flagellar hook-length control protein FliK [Marinospirillum alkaliphilum]|uniref:Flagellar hook-length control protein FliK n=1 Tax=Marinospirillum alkaliphilum DSM 21637 TaxID=1122209 RepID=A0A1K1VAR1_9GAMM|nr:flagellar hook-length control protein FliK [Marinospirillum alkaliphilum]SFX22254.1 Flagellar hook-length control protein FliK [Marinospirillum alkaliphilum DSM 21637]
MNSSAPLNFLLDVTPVSTDAVGRSQSSARSPQDGQDFQSHLASRMDRDGPTQPQHTRPTNASTRTEAPSQEKVRLHSSRGEAAQPVKETVVQGGEVLPLSDEARNFLAGLDDEVRDQLLNELHSWLANLSPEALENLQATLAEGGSLLTLLPDDLQQQMTSLLQQAEDQNALLAGLNQLVQLLSSRELDPARLAGTRVVATGLELQPVQQQDGRPLEVRDAAQRGAAPLAAEPSKNALAELMSDSSGNSGRQTGSGKQRQDSFADMVSRLSRADGAAVAVSPRQSGESLQQLLQAAGLGLPGVQAAAVGQGAARMVGMQPASIMMQAAAQANAQALASRISMMNGKGLQVAEMRLDPPHLGSVRVEIRMQGEQASVVFQAPNAHARELLEQSLPRLREMMEAEGLQLADAQVSEESHDGQGEDGKASGRSGSGYALESSDDDSQQAQVVLLDQPLGLIDYYA